MKSFRKQYLFDHYMTELIQGLNMDFHARIFARSLEIAEKNGRMPRFSTALAGPTKFYCNKKLCMIAIIA